MKNCYLKAIQKKMLWTKPEGKARHLYTAVRQTAATI